MVHNDRKPGTAAIWLSLIFPGVGQMCQKRWQPAAFFSLSTAVCLFLLFGTIAKAALAGFAVLEDVNATEVPEFPVQRVIGLAVGVLLLFVAGLVDTVTAHLRMCRLRTRSRMAESIESLASD